MRLTARANIYGADAPALAEAARRTATALAGADGMIVTVDLENVGPTETTRDGDDAVLHTRWGAVAVIVVDVRSDLPGTEPPSGEPA